MAQMPSWLWSYGLISNDPDLFRSVAIDDADGSVYVVGDAENSNIQIGPLTLFDQDQGILMKFSRTGTLIWYVPIGGSDQETAETVALAPDGTVYVAGAFTSGCYFYDAGGLLHAGSLTSFSGSKDIYLAGYSASGQFQFARQFGNGSDEGSPLIAADNSGLTLAANYTGTISMSGGHTTASSLSGSGRCVFVARLDNTGNVQWLRSGGSSVSDDLAALATDDQRIYLGYVGNQTTVRWYNGNTQIGTSTSTRNDHHITALNSDGSWAWTKAFSDPSTNLVGYPNLAIGCDGLYATGAVSTGTTFGGGNTANIGPGNDHFYLAQLQPSTGVTQWVKFGTTANNTSHFNGRDVTTGRYGTIHVGGTFEGSVSYAGQNMTGSSGMELFTMAVRPNGDLIALESSIATNEQYIGGISADRYGGVAIVGDFRSAVNIPGHPLTGPSNQNGFAAYAQYGTRMPEFGTPSRFRAPAAPICAGAGPIDLSGWTIPIVTGNANAQTASTAVTSVGNAIGAPDGSASTLAATSGSITLRLTDTLPATEYLDLVWRAVGTGSQGLLAVSFSPDNSTWTLASADVRTKRNTFATARVVTPVNAKYVRISTRPGSSTVELDAVAYTYGTMPGGTWSGPGVSGTSFDPSGQTAPYTITYTYGTGPCASVTTRSVAGDTQAPVFTCPGSQVLQAALGASTLVVNYTLPTATDNCGPVTVAPMTGTPLPGSAFPIGTTSLHFTATDAAGNVANCSWSIHVEANDAPTISCPADMTVGTSLNTCNALVSYAVPVGNDAQDGPLTATLTSGSAPGTMALGEHVQVYTVVDGDGNAATCSFSVTVIDDQAPVIANCPIDATIPIPANACIATYTFPVLSSDDNCTADTEATHRTWLMLDGSMVWTEVTGQSDEDLPLGIHDLYEVHYDAQGNSDTCSWSVTVVDDTAPVITCAGDITVTAASGACSASVTWTVPTAMDACSSPVNVTQLQGPANGSAFPVGSTTLIEYGATDAFGNAGSCSFNVVVTAPSAPVLDYPASSFCSSDAAQMPTTASPNGGTFQAPGLSAAQLDPFTGVLMPQAIAPGTYTIVYTIAGDCPASASDAITIVQAANAGSDGSLAICSHSPAASLLAALGGTPMAGGSWSGPSTVVGDQYAPMTMDPGAYTYQVAGSGPCPAVQSVVTVSETAATAWYTDVDNDGAGDPNTAIMACGQPPGRVDNDDDMCPNDPLKTEPGACGCGVVDTDSDGDGTPDCSDPCDNTTDGQACDDGNAATINDVWQDCVCSGTPAPADCLGVPGGGALPGTPCDDGDPLTIDDVWSANCSCLGTLVECESQAGPDQTVCGMSSTMEAVGTGTWSNNSGLQFADVQSPVSGVTASVAGDHEAYWTVVNGPCTAVDTVRITFAALPDPAFHYAQGTYCQDEMPPAPWTATSGGVFSAGTGLVIDPSTGVIGLSESQPGEHTITYAFGGNCPVSAITNVTIATSPTATWNAPASLCASSDPLPLDQLVTGQSGGTWSGQGVSNGFFDPFGLQGPVELTYTVTVGSCTTSEPGTIVVDPGPQAHAGQDATVCGYTRTLAAGPAGVPGTWSLPAGLMITSTSAPNAVITAPSPGSYTLVWTTSNGQCTASDEVTITFHEPYEDLFALAGPDEVVEVTGTATLHGQVSPGADIAWSVLSGPAFITTPADSITEVHGLGIGPNVFLITATRGVCGHASDTVVITMKDLFIPQGFSPNGDGVNDVFEVTGMSAFPGSTLEVFNRWGQLVYANNAYANEWDGRSNNGGQLPDDTYFHVLNLTDGTTYKGYIVIKR